MSDNLPTVKQIIEKGDSLYKKPMSHKEARAWFDWQVAENLANLKREETGEPEGIENESK